MFKWLGKIFSSGGDALVLTNEVKPKRARAKGRFKADDKSTPDVNEAWEGGKAPTKKPKAKKTKVTRIKKKK